MLADHFPRFWQKSAAFWTATIIFWNVFEDNEQMHWKREENPSVELKAKIKMTKYKKSYD